MPSRRSLLKQLGGGVGAVAGVTALSTTATAYYTNVGHRWERSEEWHCENCYYPTAIGGGTQPVNSSIDIVAEKTGGEIESTPAGDVRIHDLDIEVLLTSEYELWNDKTAQQIQEVSISLDGRNGADVQVWEDGDTETVLSGPARDESEIDETADQIAESNTGFDDTIVSLSEVLVGNTSTVGGILLDAASLVGAIIDDGGEGNRDSKTYRWDYSVPMPAYNYLNPQQPEYHDITQKYAAVIYLTDIRVAIPVDESSGVLHVEPKIDGYGDSVWLPYDIWIGNDPTTGGL